MRICRTLFAASCPGSPFLLSFWIAPVCSIYPTPKAKTIVCQRRPYLWVVKKWFLKLHNRFYITHCVMLFYVGHFLLCRVQELLAHRFTLFLPFWIAPVCSIHPTPKGKTMVCQRRPYLRVVKKLFSKLHNRFYITHCVMLFYVGHFLLCRVQELLTHRFTLFFASILKPYTSE